MKKIFLLCLLVVFVLNFMFSLFFRLNPVDLLKSLCTNEKTTEYKILTQIRIPRTLATYFVGGGLAVVGCVLQSIFLNPLCEGYTLGISSAAGLGVILSIVLNLPFTRFLSSFYGVIIAMCSIYLLTFMFKKTIDIGFVLSGVVLNFLFSGIIILLTLFFDPYKLHYVLLWLLGSFSMLDSMNVFISCIFIFILIIVILFFSNQLDVIILGREKAISLGVRDQRVKHILLLCCVIICALCVSLAGTVSFVGVVVPNVLKSISGMRHKNWFLYSLITGAIFVSVCDNIARNLLYPVEIPLNVFSGILGSIFFVVYLVKGRLYATIKS